MAGNRVEMSIAQTLLVHELGVRAAQVATVILDRPAERSTHEGDLLLNLRVHVQAVEEGTRERIVHHFGVEQVDRSHDGRLTADPPVERKRHAADCRRNPIPQRSDRGSVIVRAM